MRRNDLVAVIAGIVGAVLFIPAIFFGIGLSHHVSGRQSPAQVQAHTQQVIEEVQACSEAPVQEQGYCFRWETP